LKTPRNSYLAHTLGLYQPGGPYRGAGWNIHVGQGTVVITYRCIDHRCVRPDHDWVISAGKAHEAGRAMRAVAENKNTAALMGIM